MRNVVHRHRFDFGDGGAFALGFVFPVESGRDVVDNRVARDSRDEVGGKTAVEVAAAFEFTLDGEFYKKNRFPDESEEKQNWLNRKSISVNAMSHDCELLFSDRLIPFLCGEFEKLAPVYELLLKAELGKS